MKFNSQKASRILAIGASILVNISAAASTFESNPSQTPGKNLSSNPLTTKIITFNGLAGTDLPGAVVVTPNWTIFIGDTVVTVDGFNFDNSGEHAIIGPYQDDTSSDAWNGTDYMTAWHGTFTLRQSNDAPFTLNSIDLANAFDNGFNLADTVITGNLLGGGMVQKTLPTFLLNYTLNSAMQTGNDFTTYALTGFSNLTSVTMRIDGVVAMDNFNISTIPEPKTYAMLLAGLGFIAFMSLGGHEFASVNKLSSRELH